MMENITTIQNKIITFIKVNDISDECLCLMQANVELYINILEKSNEIYKYCKTHNITSEVSNHIHKKYYGEDIQFFMTAYNPNYKGKHDEKTRLYTLISERTRRLHCRLFEKLKAEYNTIHNE